jgi:hypothetical protein
MAWKLTALFVDYMLLLLTAMLAFPFHKGGERETTREGRERQQGRGERETRRREEVVVEHTF